MWDQNPQSVKFMDECGIEISSASRRTYGHAPVGQRAIEIVRHHQRPNKTVNMLIGLDGLFCNIIDGPSNTQHYLNFFHQALDTNTSIGIPILRPGDIVVADNCPFHHNDAERILRPWFANLRIQYTFTPRYNPDFNPVEMCFSKLKSVLKQDRFRRSMHTNMEVAIYDATQEITYADICNFYKHTRCFNM